MQLIGPEIRHFLYPLLLATGVITAVQADTPAVSDAEIAVLIEQLGADDYAARERAAASLDALGPAAIDSLLAAVESHAALDIEVSLRAQWLADSIPIVDARDDPQVAALVQQYRRQSFFGRVKLMRRLLRADYDAGVEPLARLARLERDPALARIAAALLVGEWTPGDPAWAAMSPRILAGLGGSGRQAAALLRTIVLFSQATSADDRGRLAREGRDLLPGLARLAARPMGTAATTPDDPFPQSLLVFERGVADMLVAAGLRDEAVVIVKTRIEAALKNLPDDAGNETHDLRDAIAENLVWSSEHGLGDVVTTINESTAAGVQCKPILYAAAACERSRGRAAEATRLAEAAFTTAKSDFSDRAQAAILLVQWGQSDWACREFTAMVDDPGGRPERHTFAAVLYCEHLHDQGRDAEAAMVLRAVVEPSRDEAGYLAALLQLGRDPLMARSRMHYFEACAAAVRGDDAGRRKALDAAASTVAKDIDALIAMYELPDASPEHRARVRGLIAEALTRIEGQMDAVPDDLQTRNEWAWLVANTEGDIAKATAYSRATLEGSPDNASYLDTLAHCHAAAHDYDLAIRAQRLAQRLEPHNRLIRLNLEKFEREAAAAGAR